MSGARTSRREGSGPPPQQGDIILDRVHGLWQYGLDGSEEVPSLLPNSEVILRASEAFGMSDKAFDGSELGWLRANGLLLWARGPKPLRGAAGVMLRYYETPPIRTMRRILRGTEQLASEPSILESPVVPADQASAQDTQTSQQRPSPQPTELVSEADGGWPRRTVHDRTVAFLGDFPYPREDLMDTVPFTKLVADLADGDQFIDTIVLGWEVDDIDAALSRIDQWPMPARFLPQEGWMALLHLGTDWWLDNADTLNRFADEGHPLDQVRSAWPDEKPWPGTEAAPSNGGHASDVPLSDVGPLRALGYQITGLTREERWRILTRDLLPELGLMVTANQIAGLVRLRLTHPDGATKFANAISEWRHDLDRLYRDYYRTGKYTFRWPEAK